MTKLLELLYHCTLPSQKHISIKNSTFIIDSDVENKDFIYINIFISRLGAIISMTQIQMFTRKTQNGYHS